MGDEACEQNCLAMHQGGIADAVLVSDCAGTICSGSCMFGEPIDPCEECALTGCEAEMNACLALPACSALWGCLTGCPQLDLTCQQQCYQDFGAGTATLQAALQCINQTCMDECQ